MPTTTFYHLDPQKNSDSLKRLWPNFHKKALPIQPLAKLFAEPKSRAAVSINILKIN